MKSMKWNPRVNFRIFHASFQWGAEPQTSISRLKVSCKTLLGNGSSATANDVRNGGTGNYKKELYVFPYKFRNGNGWNNSFVFVQQKINAIENVLISLNNGDDDESDIHKEKTFVNCWYKKTITDLLPVHFT